MLQSIRILNFRSCVDCKVDFNESVSALVGRNGVGKTNILRAIEWLARTAATVEAPKLDFFLHEEGEVRFSATARLGERTYHYDLLFVRSGPPPRLENGFSLEERLDVEDQAHSTSLIRRRAEDVKLAGGVALQLKHSTPAVSAVASLLPESDELQHHLTAFMEFVRAVTYYQLPTEPEPEESGLIIESEYRKWRTEYSSSRTLPASPIFKLLYAWQEDKELFEEFQSIVGERGLGLVDSVSFQKLDMPPEPDNAKMRQPQPGDSLFVCRFTPSPDVGGTGNRFFFSDLSAGTRRVIKIVVSILFDRRSVMLIEQPEDCIHPGLLRKVLDIMRSYSDRTQIVFSTHRKCSTCSRPTRFASSRRQEA